MRFAFASIALLAAVSASPESDACGMCHSAVNALHTEIHGDDNDDAWSEADVRLGLDYVCHHLPASAPTAHAECTSLMRTHGADLAKVLMRKTHPKHVCGTLGFCAADATVSFVPELADLADVLMTPTDGINRMLDAVLTEFCAEQPDGTVSDEATQRDVDNMRVLAQSLARPAAGPAAPAVAPAAAPVASQPAMPAGAPPGSGPPSLADVKLPSKSDFEKAEFPDMPSSEDIKFDRASW